MTISMSDVKRSGRTGIMRNRVLEAPYRICVERARYVTESWKRTEGEHPSVRAALAFDNVLRNMSIFILDEERIVGNYCNDIVGTALPVERGEMNFVLELDLDNLVSREQRPYLISPEDRAELMNEILPYWRGRTVRDEKYEGFREAGLLITTFHSPMSAYYLVKSFGFANLRKTLSRFTGIKPSHLIKSSKALAVNNPNLINNVFDVQGHLIIGHNRMLPRGFRAVRDAAAMKMETDLPENKRKFIEGVLICAESARMFAGRFASLAFEKAMKEADPVRKAELLEISRIAKKVPWEPPETFAEALQFMWFTQVMAVISAGLAGINAVGRPDQYLYPYYLKDVVEDRLDATTATEMVEELLIKLSNNLIMLPSFGKDTGSELGADSMAPTIGGVNRNGTSAVNELSYIFLDAIKNIKAMSNSYSVRLSDNTPADFYMKLSEVHSVTSGIAIFNDETLIPALQRCGYSLEDARDYGVIGCVEPTSQGNTFGCTSGNDVSLAGALEMVFTRGRIRMVGRRVGPDTGDPRSFETFDDFLQAYRSQLAFSVKLIADCVNVKDRIYMEGFHNPFISSTFEGCVENAMDMTEGGAKYNFASISGRGLATVSDSLCAIKTLVYDEGKVTMKEMAAAVATNFRGRESLRQQIKNRAPKYGRDDATGDEMAKMVAAMFCDEVAKHSSVRDDAPFRPGFFSYGMHVMDGSLLGATPDGRLAGEPVSNSLSPVNGVESKGPTAVMCSASKMDHERISNGSSLNIKLLPKIFDTEEGRRRFESMLRGYFDMGGAHVQFNVVDNEMLRDAQKNPDNYRGLIVRVSGYVAYFVDLGESLQNELISRTELSL